MHQSIKWIRFLLAASLAWLGLSAGGAGAANTADNLVQIVAKDSATGRTVSWQNTTPRTDYTVEYRAKGTTDSQQAYVTEPKRPPIYDENNVPPYTYGAYMQQLKPATDYEYRVRNEDGATPWYTFATTTEQLNEYKVLVFGDSQSVDYSVWGQTARTAWESNDDAAFFVNMGDLTDNGQAWFQWRDWYENANVLTGHIPFAPVLGNHEAYSMDWQFAQPYTYKALFAVPYGSPEGQSRMAYSFDYGDVHYVSLNTDYEELHEEYPNMMEHEASWLDTDLQTAVKNGKRLVVLMHRPPWNSPYDGQKDINGQYFMPIFDKYNVPLVFVAHEHVYARTQPMKDNQPAQQGTVYITTGRSGTEPWADAVRRPFDTVYYNPMDMPMYLILQVEPQEFRVTALKVDGTVVDTLAIPAVSPGSSR
ncbi:MAG: metallophosphoesterase family protein [Megasphaera sp.]|nr:metallophosphoesterase family protein [Megasphaera sp.]MCH4188440.1 metallophosphoesterase family protein [Megasphaera sp.]MCH4218159.1 metallophosphoesterase family protein [Megasphaera sp.]